MPRAYEMADCSGFKAPEADDGDADRADADPPRASTTTG